MHKSRRNLFKTFCKQCLKELFIWHGKSISHIRTDTHYALICRGAPSREQLIKFLGINSHLCGNVATCGYYARPKFKVKPSMQPAYSFSAFIFT